VNVVMSGSATPSVIRSRLISLGAPGSRTLDRGHHVAQLAGGLGGGPPRRRRDVVVREHRLRALCGAQGRRQAVEQGSDLDVEARGPAEGVAVAVGGVLLGCSSGRLTT